MGSAAIQMSTLGGREQNKQLRTWEVVVAQLAERSLPIPEDLGSNPVIGNFY